jgi:hypothetical protein
MRATCTTHLIHLVLIILIILGETIGYGRDGGGLQNIILKSEWKKSLGRYGEYRKTILK